MKAFTSWFLATSCSTYSIQQRMLSPCLVVTPCIWNVYCRWKDISSKFDVLRFSMNNQFLNDPTTEHPSRFGLRCSNSSKPLLFVCRILQNLCVFGGFDMGATTFLEDNINFGCIVLGSNNLCVCRYSCPLCSRSYCDMSSIWEQLDQEVHTTYSLRFNCLSNFDLTWSLRK